jgi:hypothetical protein
MGRGVLVHIMCRCVLLAVMGSSVVGVNMSGGRVGRHSVRGLGWRGSGVWRRIDKVVPCRSLRDGYSVLAIRGSLNHGCSRGG